MGALQILFGGWALGIVLCAALISKLNESDAALLVCAAAFGPVFVAIFYVMWLLNPWSLGTVAGITVTAWSVVHRWPAPVSSALAIGVLGFTYFTISTGLLWPYGVQ